MLNLLWKPIKAPLRFVFAITSRGPIVLMCSDLESDPLMAIALYLSLSRLNHRLPRSQAYPEVMQGTAAFHHQIADTLLP